MNEFSDLPFEEFKAKYLGYGNQNTGRNLQVVYPTYRCSGFQPSTYNLPVQIDWVAKGGVTAVKNQGQCGSCWAFSSIGALQGAYFKKKKYIASLSEQQLIDCSGSYGNAGCNGGWMDQAFYYVKDNGITLGSKYPFTGIQSTCQYNASNDKVFSILDCTNLIPNSQRMLMAAINQQPVSLAIEVVSDMQLYKSGVYTGNCGSALNHGVLAVGYGNLNGINYYKVKNSWGTSWGMNGYILIERIGDGDGKCGIQIAPSYPIA